MNKSLQKTRKTYFNLSFWAQQHDDIHKNVCVWAYQARDVYEKSDNADDHYSVFQTKTIFPKDCLQTIIKKFQQNISSS